MRGEYVFLNIPENELLLEALTGLGYRPAARLNIRGRVHAYYYRFTMPEYVSSRVRWVLGLDDFDVREFEEIL